MTAVVVLAVALFLPMLVETAISARNERGLRAAGAIEPYDDVIRLMQVAYPAAFVSMIGEAWLRDVVVGDLFVWGAGLFALAKIVKYWAIATLGPRWTFRVLVPPDSSPIRTGPYRFVRHPNYIAVVGELAGAAVMSHAWVAGPLATAGFIWLMARRIVVEERALGLRKV